MASVLRVTDEESLTTSASTSRSLPIMLGVCFCATSLIGFDFEKDWLIFCCGRKVLGSLFRATWMLCSASRRIFFFAFLSFLSSDLCDLIARVTWVSEMSSVLLERRLVATDRKSGECVLTILPGRHERRPCHFVLVDLVHPLSCSAFVDVYRLGVPDEEESVATRRLAPEVDLENAASDAREIKRIV